MDDLLSVSELTEAIKAVLESDIGTITVTGEISNYKAHTSGHRYFTLKDENAQIACTMWRSSILKFTPEDGMRVVVRGRLTVYPPQGRYQISCTTMEVAGIGELYIAFEKLKKNLAARGWFDEARKRLLPSLPSCVGIATSGSGAAIHDMLRTIAHRYPLLKVVFRPTVVQGPEAPADVARAISDLASSGVDCIIIGRGGGSIEDLWAFNTEEVARAVVDCPVPVISAVGHETDTTISDFVADRRAPTPTAAAVFVTPLTIGDINSHATSLINSSTTALRTLLRRNTEMIADALDGRHAWMCLERIMMRSQRVDELEERACSALLKLITKNQDHVNSAEERARILHPLAPLSKGFALIERGGKILPTAQPLHPGDVIVIKRKTDSARATVNNVSNN